MVENVVQKEMDVMIKKAIWIGLTMSLLGLVSTSSARADEWNKKTILTFSQPFEIPGKVLPAGKYMFKLADSTTDRHIVQVFTADGKKILATVMAIPDVRIEATNRTVVNFREVPAGSPEAIRAWFYPGNTIGQEFVYSKQRAAQLAKLSKTPVPAMAVDVASVEELKKVEIVAITPDEKETPLAASIQTAPVENSSSSAVGTTGVVQTGQSASNRTQLPKTASSLPLVMLLGFASICLAFAMMMFGKRVTASAV